MILAISVLFQNRLILPSLWKSPFSEKANFFRTMGPKKMDSPFNLPSKTLCFGQKIFFQIFWKNWSKLCCFWSKMWKNKGNDIKTADSVFFKEVWLLRKSCLQTYIVWKRWGYGGSEGFWGIVWSLINSNVIQNFLTCLQFGRQ